MSSSRRSQSQLIPIMDWESHNDKSEHNRKIAKLLEDHGSCDDWLIITLYYSVIHKVNAFLAKFRNYEGKSINHPARRRLVSSDPDLMLIGILYELLETEAFQTRYDPTYLVPDVLLEESIIDADAIREHIDKLL